MGTQDPYIGEPDFPPSSAADSCVDLGTSLSLLRFPLHKMWLIIVFSNLSTVLEQSTAHKRLLLLSLVSQ